MAKIQLACETVFERHEKKYRISPATYQQILDLLTERMRPDQYGLYTICSLYFDTADYSLIRRSLEKPAYKEKLRLRSYGIPGPEDTVFLELKKKVDGVTYKRRAPLTLREAEAYLNGGVPPAGAGQILDEIDWFRRRYRPEPKVLLCYDRIALYGIQNSALRITFDTNIRWRTEQLGYPHGICGTPLLAPGERLMEIKLAGAFPCWLSRLLSEQRVFPVSFSKYGEVYRQAIHKQEETRHVG